MKKFLSLVLALVMTMSLVTVSAGAKDFTDSSKINYSEAVDVMSAAKVIDGYAEGDFRPTATLTRGAAAKIICNMILGPTTASALVADAAPYKDVPANHTFAGYIAYCQKTGIISGYADGTFKPANTLTGYAFMKMLLGALGYKADVEGYTSPNWSINVAKQAINAGLNKGLKGDFNGVKAVNREEACLYAFNTLKATMVEYDTTITIGGVTVAGARKDVTNSASIETIKNDDKMQFAERYFTKLTKKSNVTDDFGRPAVTWINNKTEVGTYVDYTTLVSSYTAKVKGGEVYNDIGSAAAKFDEVTYYVDGKVQPASVVTDLMSDVKKSNKDTFGASGKGVLTEVYVDTDEETIDVVIINTYIADVSADYNDKKEYLSVGVKNYGANAPTKVYLDDVAGIEKYKEDDVILVQIADGVILNVIDPKTVEDAAISKFATDDYVVTGGNQYDFAEKINRYNNVLNEYNKEELEDKTYDIYVDQYGYAIGIKLHSGTDKYLFLAGYDKTESNLTLKTAEAQVIFMDGTMSKVAIDFNETNKKLERETAPKDVDKLVQNGDANRNQWFKYTEDDGVYTLTAVADQIVVAYGDTGSAKKSINCESARVAEGSKYAWGNDDSVYITVKTDEVDSDVGDYRYADVKFGISKVDAVYTGVQDVDLVLNAKSPFKTSTAAPGDVIYALYDTDDKYIDAAIVLGESNDDNSKAYAYALKGAKSESFKDGNYYWEFDAAVGGKVETLTVKTKYTDVIDTIQKAIVDEDKTATYGIKGLLKLTYDKDGYVTKAVVVDNTASDIYGSSDFNASKDINPDIFKAYEVKHNQPKDLVCTGRTLYTDVKNDVGLTLASGAPVVVVQIVEDEDGDLDRSIEEYSTISAALNALKDEGKNFQGTIAADLNDKGTAEWIVISSSNVVPYEKKTSSSDSTKAGKLDVTTVEYASGAYNVTATVTKELKGVKSYTVKLTTVNGAVIAEKSADVTGTGDYAVKDTATVTLTSAQKKAEEANVEFTFFDKDGNVLASASGLFAL
ncbi:S-layer homology domain-containing protein [Dysosmobacter sp.]|uniref:S-layer homology domain-containing protein n=1 Tax=Dysosmobacter sp. TaxID=2591382 RepID=UPI003AB43C8D